MSLHYSHNHAPIVQNEKLPILGFFFKHKMYIFTCKSKNYLLYCKNQVGTRILQACARSSQVPVLWAETVGCSGGFVSISLLKQKYVFRVDSRSGGRTYWRCGS